ncbi:uncharacterized protein LOC133202400 [Saccostrea echinata]|uniref:uncharacterized protein LOC133202400 n=1 Tax=Saccostrea echinata TaxID=191078 RepID=UPI002A80CD49|nr:uncharacterized protein LOC133202400 [Saccostrea echinata]
MRFLTIFTLIFASFLDVDGWWVWGKEGNNNGCSKRDGAYPYYFGTTDLLCVIMESLKRGKRSAPSRGTLDLSHRFIEYRGNYYDFLSNSKVSISKTRLWGDSCSGKKEASPAGYSELSPECIKGCARNYKCKYGSYNLLTNSCHHLANRLSKVLCRRGTTCPDWCTGSCNDVV